MKIPLIVGLSLLPGNLVVAENGRDPLWKDSSAAALAAAEQVVTVVTPLVVVMAV